MTGKIRIGVLGAGRWGPNLIRNFHTNLKSTVVMVADKQTARLKMIQERYPDVQVTENEDQVLAHPDVDAVVIVTPTNTHFDLTAKAIKSGKHVFVEKPLAQTAPECRELVAMADKAGKVLFVGHVFVYNAGIQTVKKYIDSGELGQIYYIHATRTNLGPIRSDVNALWDLAPHDLSILQYWLGERPSAVSAVGGKFLNSKIEDAVFANYSFSKNLLAQIHVSWLNPKKVREIVIVAEKKMLLWDDMELSNPIKIYDKKVVFDRAQETLVDTFVGFRTSIFEGDTIIPKVVMNEPLSAECAAFLKAVEHPASSLSTGREGLSVVEMLAATDVSVREGGARIPIHYVQ